MRRGLLILPIALLAVTGCTLSHTEAEARAEDEKSAEIRAREMRGDPHGREELREGTNRKPLDQLILIHTPHLEDKHKGTSIIVDVLKNDRRIKPQRVLIDHCEEHTIRIARDNGFWAGLTIYPVTKITPQRGADILEQFGPQMICVNSASDWGESSPSMLTDTMLEFRRRGHDERECLSIFHDNPCRFLGQSGKLKIEPAG